MVNSATERQNVMHREREGRREKNYCKQVQSGTENTGVEEQMKRAAGRDWQQPSVTRSECGEEEKGDCDWPRWRPSIHAQAELLPAGGERNDRHEPVQKTKSPALYFSRPMITAATTTTARASLAGPPGLEIVDHDSISSFASACVIILEARRLREECNHGASRLYLITILNAPTAL